MEYEGRIEEQEWDVAVDEAAGDLVLAMNGRCFVRLRLPHAVWAALARAAGRVAAAQEAG